jgi:hypothetical protein
MARRRWGHAFLKYQKSFLSTGRAHRRRPMESWRRHDFLHEKPLHLSTAPR